MDQVQLFKNSLPQVLLLPEKIRKTLVFWYSQECVKKETSVMGWVKRIS